MTYTLISSGFTARLVFNERFIVIDVSPVLAWLKGKTMSEVEMVCLRRGYRLERV